MIEWNKMTKEPTQEQKELSQGIAEEFVKFYSEKAEIQNKQDWEETQDLFLQRSISEYQGGK